MTKSERNIKCLMNPYLPWALLVSTRSHLPCLLLSWAAFSSALPSSELFPSSHPLLHAGEPWLLLLFFRIHADRHWLSPLSSQSPRFPNS